MCHSRFIGPWELTDSPPNTRLRGQKGPMHPARLPAEASGAEDVAARPSPQVGEEGTAGKKMIVDQQKGRREKAPGQEWGPKRGVGAGQDLRSMRLRSATSDPCSDPPLLQKPVNPGLSTAPVTSSFRMGSGPR